MDAAARRGPPCLKVRSDALLAVTVKGKVLVDPRLGDFPQSWRPASYYRSVPIENLLSSDAILGPGSPAGDNVREQWLKTVQRFRESSIKGLGCFKFLP